MVFAPAPQIHLNFIDHGFKNKLEIGIREIHLKLADGIPANAKGLPALQKPEYATIQIGDNPRPITIVLDTAVDHDYKIFIDANGNGDFSDDPAVSGWKAHSYTDDGKKYEYYVARDAMLNAHVAGKDRKVGVDLIWDSSDPGNIAYAGDYGLYGEVKLGGATYNAALVDSLSRGVFTDAKYKTQDGSLSSGVGFLIDVNHDGAYARTGERYDAYKPFNIAGTTYQLRNVEKGRPSVGVSSETVAEILPPPNLQAGNKIPSFDAATMDGTPVSFPSAYKGKVVMLDFWATWCGPCVAELPNILANYQKYHDRGYEILGVSFDQPNQADKVKNFMANKGMTWAQIYEGKYWNTTLGTKFGIDSIPHAVLVDGDTGEILANGEDLRGDKLEPAIQKALAKKHLGK